MFGRKRGATPEYGTRSQNSGSEHPPRRGIQTTHQPYEFQGLGKEGLRLLALAKEQTGLKIVTEILSEVHVEHVAEVADILQVGARNAQNFQLLIACAKSGKPVLLKRGLSERIDEWLLAAEYLLAHGNGNVLFCERGIRTFETYTRNTLDLAAVAIMKKESHLPIIIDPSQGCGTGRSRARSVQRSSRHGG